MVNRKRNSDLCIVACTAGEAAEKAPPGSDAKRRRGPHLTPRTATPFDDTPQPPTISPQIAPFAHLVRLVDWGEGASMTAAVAIVFVVANFLGAARRGQQTTPPALRVNRPVKTHDCSTDGGMEATIGGSNFLPLFYWL